MVTVYFVCFITLIFAIGIYSYRFSQKKQSDYLLASRSISPWQTALSSLATTYSGFIYIGLVGYVWTHGLSGIWLVVFLILGELVAVLYVPKKVLRISKREKMLSYGELLSTHQGKIFKSVKIISALISLLFLAIYAAAQLSAAGKTLHAMLDWQHNIGVFVGYVIVLGYCFAGGIRASIWTDCIQLVTMIIAMSILVFMGLDVLGGWQQFWQKLTLISPEYGDFFPSQMGGFFAIALFCLGYFFAGLGITGQPHIVVRYMTMAKEKYAHRMLYYYYPTALLFTSLALFSALLARVYFADTNAFDLNQFDAEAALPTFALAILPPILVALVLSGIFSAIISTVDSQILSCSATLAYDLAKKNKKPQTAFWHNKIATIFVATLVLVLAITANQSVFSLVMLAWSTLAASFAPLLTFRLLGFAITEKQALITIMTGLSSNIVWAVFGNALIYEGFIGMLSSASIFLVIHLKQKNNVSHADNK